ncbi:hypothetical protein ILUMI_17416, partial [Ignelater luminosus]
PTPAFNLREGPHQVLDYPFRRTHGGLLWKLFGRAFYCTEGPNVKVADKIDEFLNSHSPTGHKACRCLH